MQNELVWMLLNIKGATSKLGKIRDLMNIMNTDTILTETNLKQENEEVYKKKEFKGFNIIPGSFIRATFT